MDDRARKISETMRARGLDNFKHWRDEMKKRGLIKTEYPSLVHDGNLAELIGTTLGDGHLYKHDRCDSLRIVGDAKKMSFVNRSADLIEFVFKKKPSIVKVRASNAMTVTIYEKHLAKRLGLPHGSRAQYEYRVPSWIRKDKGYIARFLRGLYEAEGSIGHHPGTYTHKLVFANTNPHLLALVAELVRTLGFTVSVSTTRVQVSRKAEVQDLENLLQFRRY